MAQFGMGQPVKRVEDVRFLTGRGRYTDDQALPRQAHTVFLRSPHANARIKAIDVAKAAKAPGVLAVLTGKDFADAGVQPLPCQVPLQNRDGSPMPMRNRRAIALDQVRFVGDPVAMIVAETAAQARDAAELVAVDYQELPAIGDVAGAIAAGAPLVWGENKGNVAFDWTAGDEKAAAAAFAGAHKVVSIDLVNNRLAPSSMEPRTANGDFDPATGRLTLHVSCQGGNGIRKVLAGEVFKLPESRIRVVTGDVGGGFGMKIFLFPEYVCVLHAARVVGRPVKWVGDRSESFLADTHGRDHLTHAELALDKDGKFLGMKVRTHANLGAYLSHYGPFIPTMAGTNMLAGVYTTPAIFVEVKGIYTNTAPLDAYRGAGRPEANYVMERLVDKAARETGLGPVAIRKRNFIPAASMPYKQALGCTYDSGDFARNLDDALKAADHAGFEARRAASAKRGKRRGIGIATYIEECGGGPEENARVQFDAGAGVTVYLANQSNGQGHETAYAQIIAERLGVPFESVRLMQGDTDAHPYAGLTGGSRAMSVGGTAILNASERIVAKGKAIAAHLMEAAAGDIAFKDGTFTVAGTDKSKTIKQVAKAAFDMTKLPPGMQPGLDETANFTAKASTFPNGCHVVEVEIDPETGRTSVERYTIVDDFGKVINPLLLAGQVHGGTAQGIGQALLENCVYDRKTAQLLTGSFMDYCMPRAGDIPDLSFAYNEVPCTSTPLGVKGAGEAGAIGAPPAVMNAVMDALAPLGVARVDMPATPLKVWTLIKEASKKAA